MIEVRRLPGVARCAGVSSRETSALAEAMLDRIGLAGAGAHILLAGDSEIARLNRLHLGLSGPTNVLSFPAEEHATVFGDADSAASGAEEDEPFLSVDGAEYAGLPEGLEFYDQPADLDSSDLPDDALNGQAFFPDAEPDGLTWEAGTPDSPDEDAPPYLGELAISMDAVAREGFLYGEGFCRTFARLLCHGLLHLAGYDHGPVMDGLTESLLDELAP
ncbi:rRNA maturation RNAse YbeY [Oceanidesulfovibrio marinus]|uniref:Endoribonuclease YbeY n=1 Tax=Oceanidesulfovibrio marinus TaxID=370038 RepID=A0A6P1ZI83_9BACT|nr:rRNA maturation RNAse YbeY [Oceanidesulfovibrio marinus]QJT08566.1 rRNA maturation RNAse YbeY [Oceanidesulfovibrio marinus]TVM32600.1 hypothetical protein DQK91_15120 [Oceanidesulfovibrio marinus]